MFFGCVLTFQVSLFLSLLPDVFLAPGSVMIKVIVSMFNFELGT